jgi:D-2-hydroxyacid dehydrogenase (NADP+)
MRVVGISRVARPLPGFDQVYPREELQRVVADLDFLVLLIPYSEATRHIVGDAVLSAMKSTSYLVNIARGGVLDEDALVRALQRKAIAGAALDVTQIEPLPPGHPLWSQDRLTITPHLGGYYDRYVEDSIDQICDNLRIFLQGRLDELRNRIDRPPAAPDTPKKKPAARPIQ